MPTRHNNSVWNGKPRQTWHPRPPCTPSDLGASVEVEQCRRSRNAIFKKGFNSSECVHARLPWGTSSQASVEGQRPTPPPTPAALRKTRRIRHRDGFAAPHERRSPDLATAKSGADQEISASCQPMKQRNRTNTAPPVNCRALRRCLGVSEITIRLRSARSLAQATCCHTIATRASSAATTDRPEIALTQTMMRVQGLIRAPRYRS
jgi:hypothetical protein